TSVKDMIKILAQSKAKIADTNEEKYVEDRYVADGYVNNQTTNETTSNVGANTTNAADTILIDKPEALILTNEEIALMQDMSEVIGNNPRAIKRFVNIYRIIKAHEEFDYEAVSTKQELSAILFLLALPLGDYRK